MEQTNNNVLAKKFTLFELVKFTIPTISMMMFLSLYVVVDGLFVANFVSSDALAAVNIAYPIIGALFALSIMFATGGTAIVSYNQGENKMQLASENFSMVTFTNLIIGLSLAFIFFIFSDSLLLLLGSNQILLPLAKEYLIILLLFSPFLFLQTLFEPFFVSAGKPNLGFILIVCAGITNIILDYIFIVLFEFGISGAAYATGISYMIPSVGGVIFFFRNKSGLHFKSFKFDIKTIIKSAYNGSSEMVTLLSSSVINATFNIFMMKFLGSIGVASITIVLYIQFLLSSMFIGFAIGVSPIISYHYGAKNLLYLKELIKISILLISITSVVVFVVSYNIAPFLSELFAAGNKEILELSTKGLELFSFAFLFMGMNIFASALFTALGNGKVSAFLSFMRTFFFSIIGIYAFSHFFKETGLFISIPFAELGTLFLTIYFIRRFIKKYIPKVYELVS